MTIRKVSSSVPNPSNAAAAAGFHFRKSTLAVALSGLMGALASPYAAAAITVNVVDDTGAPVSGFRYVVEQDDTYRSPPGERDVNSLGMNFHKSHMPVMRSGHSTAANVTIPTTAAGQKSLEANKFYQVSALPNSGYTLASGSVPEGGSVTLTVHAVPVPTAQITVQVFKDDFIINGVPDAPQEDLADTPDPTFDPTQFSIQLADAGGQYGACCGRVTKDAFGNPLGTTYQIDVNGNPVMVDGAPEVLALGTGVLHPDANGMISIKYLAPAKYGVTVSPPAGQDDVWHQTSTIEGTKTVDAWVMADEPTFFAEFGPPAPHVFIGFIKENKPASVAEALNPLAPVPGANVTGRIVNRHNAKPPAVAFFDGEEYTGGCWVGLNTIGGTGKSIYAAPCDAGAGTFTIPDVPPGNYQLVVWDDPLDLVIHFQAVTIGADLSGGNVGNVQVFSWFGRMLHKVFNDTNRNGQLDPGETDVANSNINLRFRDGRIYNSMPTDIFGESPMMEVFPFFHWLVAESDYSRFEPTGATFTMDDGGFIDPNDPIAQLFDGMLKPQIQADGQPQRTELSTPTAPVLTEAFQVFLGQTNAIQWGRIPWTKGKNGGIGGTVTYASVRAEDEPRYAAVDLVEPGIPRVQVNLYQDKYKGTTTSLGADGNIDNVNGVAGLQYADVDNYPFSEKFDPTQPVVECPAASYDAATKTCTNPPADLNDPRMWTPGPEDTDKQTIGKFDAGDAMRIVRTDSFDDSVPTDCVATPFTLTDALGNTKTADCYDGMRVFNQVRPGVFDGGYLFKDYYSRGATTKVGTAYPFAQLMPAGTYIVEAKIPPGYEVIKEQDKNVVLGESRIPSKNLLPPLCVGDKKTVPAYLSMQTADTDNNPATAEALIVNATDAIAAPFAGSLRPLCDRKQVTVYDQQNAAADFQFFTRTPIAGHIVGMILDDTANEFDPNSPNFGEKYAPPWLPVAVKDWTGTEVARVHADEWGRFNILVPSTWSMDVPMASGISPNMLQACMNDPGNGATPDPFYNPVYSTFCYTFQYIPGATTYLDTPVIPLAAHAGQVAYPVDCEMQDLTPEIASATGPLGIAFVKHNQTLTITSMGDKVVANPAYDPTVVGSPKTITRHFGFGNSGNVLFLNAAGNVVFTSPHNNSDPMITLSVPNTVAAGDYQVVVESAGKRTPVGVTVTVATAAAANPTNIVNPGQSIQTLIDSFSVAPGSAVYVKAGTYQEMVIMHKPVRLQGAGSGVTTINALRSPPAKLQNWRTHVDFLHTQLQFDLLPTQAAPASGAMAGEEGAAVTVLGNNNGEFANSPNRARIDGFTLTGAIGGGGVYVNGYANNLDITNNRISGNNGNYGGGILVGRANDTVNVSNRTQPVDAMNDNLKVASNHISGNGSVGPEGAGGGISLFTGADSYQVTGNFICGNYTPNHGGGIAHQGLSNNGLIQGNTIAFNESRSPSPPNSNGGGIFVGGVLPANGGLGLGTGNVVVFNNLIQGNEAGSGAGGGVAVVSSTGATVDAEGIANGLIPWAVQVAGNQIVNNVAAAGAGGVYLQDATNVAMASNTVAHNDSTSTNGDLIVPVPGNNGPFPLSTGVSESLPRVAGVIADANSAGLTALGGAASSVPVPFANNIVWENRSFYVHMDMTNLNAPVFELRPDTAHPCSTFALAQCWDVNFAAAGNGNLLTGGVNPGFLNPYFNTGFNQNLAGLGIAGAFDEGGNFVDVWFQPLSLGSSSYQR